ncbi:hypothetical protein [Gloeothece verrucosa]|uniref:RAMP superfamily protein n=1 Tax=Gloeothece verrucosa (strain PCC 7822) TaxID=497965 RepID=E0UKK9_GLOV7|nr:hypothetical protein [Gloeothece verrucosa]ADN17489.1 hypothetical protein Cyan7822_5623 [Gloeothece verrucosa PCC 7822]
MVNINQIPLMFRAQIEGRCQIQRLIPKQETQEAYHWVDQWVEGVEEEIPDFSSNIQTKEYQMTWRFVSNGGQDEGVIRPVIGAKGFPFYPGSSMKGAFLRACTEEEALKYCGGKKGNEINPGILRFHGGYPNSLEWIEEELVDIVHPQQDWQVKTNANHSAFIQISLHQPTLVFGISSTRTLEVQEWEKIWKIWEAALGKGIGCRVSAGYGQPKNHTANSLLSIHLQGKGLASQSIKKGNNEVKGEFRANLFKAALRGHTLRLLGGVTDEKTAERLTQELWGGIGGTSGATIGQLGISFEVKQLSLDKFTYTPSRYPVSFPTYKVKGRLDLLCLQNLSEKKQENLTRFVTDLIQFSLLLGGFGKSWRRVDHELFFPEYLKNGNKPMIGCHWQFIEQSRKLYIPVNQLEDIKRFLEGIYQSMQGWVKYKKANLNLLGCNWREAFHPNRVQVWGRIANSQDDSEAIYWFHQAYRSNQTIKQTELTGKLNKIGRIWHRMYPRSILVERGRKYTSEYVELLTIFPDDSQNTRDFILFLQESSSFEKLWGN